MDIFFNNNIVGKQLSPTDLIKHINLASQSAWLYLVPKYCTSKNFGFEKRTSLLIRFIPDVGIEERLPYFADLGIQAIWLSPIYKSPMKDFGYDISDFKDVDETFGTLDDIKSLIKAAHDLGTIDFLISFGYWLDFLVKYLSL